MGRGKKKNLNQNQTRKSRFKKATSYLQLFISLFLSIIKLDSFYLLLLELKLVLGLQESLEVLVI